MLGALGAMYVTQKVSVCSSVHAWSVSMRAKGKAGRGQQRGVGGRGERRRETRRGTRRKERGECSETETEQESYAKGLERKQPKRKRNTTTKNGCNSGKVDAVIWRDRYRDLAWNAVICIWHPETTPNQTRTTTTRTNKPISANIISARSRDL